MAALGRVWEDVAETNDLPGLAHDHERRATVPTRQPVQLGAMPIGDGEVPLVAALLGTAIVHGSYGIGVLGTGQTDPDRPTLDGLDPAQRVLVARRCGDGRRETKQRRRPRPFSTFERRPRALEDHVALGGPLQTQHIRTVVLTLNRGGDLHGVCLDQFSSRERRNLGGLHHRRRTVDDAGRQVERVVRRSLPDVGVSAGGQRSCQDHVLRD